MLVSRALLGLGAAIYLGSGLVILVRPQIAAKPVGIELPKPSAVTDFRVVYAGLSLGLGAFMGLCAARPAWTRMGLMAGAITFGAMTATRAYGLVVDGSNQKIGWVIGATELASFGLMVAGLAALPAEG